ncbi:hypothetical protein C8J55DRAFT_527277 [Lentinula edodes]|uniref:Uncharacterized protein n=1 Tax=Lentinula lateritia TaxID=40482 RepID=A0A9W8ZTD7_9AGAR|nr:hypothetical protein C8J55DRAFT_527277 [Lentinula edodes]
MFCFPCCRPSEDGDKECEGCGRRVKIEAVNLKRLQGGNFPSILCCSKASKERRLSG